MTDGWALRGVTRGSSLQNVLLPLVHAYSESYVTWASCARSTDVRVHWLRGPSRSLPGRSFKLDWLHHDGQSNFTLACSQAPSPLAERLGLVRCCQCLPLDLSLPTVGLVAELPTDLSPFSNGRRELCAVNWGRLRSPRACPNRACRQCTGGLGLALDSPHGLKMAGGRRGRG
jgi:hypothetical protein